MTNIIRAALVLGFLACSPSLASDLYRCDLADGRTVYQGDQCQIGAGQKAIDRQNARREQIRKAREQEREQKRQKSGAVKTAG
jgi:Spy/CpxP family protein refolding chaperone